STNPAASIAPVFPAETAASARSSRTSRQVTTSELSRLVRTASAGFSSIAIVVRASTSSSPPVSRPGGPTSTGVISGDAASSAPATISSGALSPPIASTATRAAIVLGTERAERLDLAAAVRLAVLAHLVRPRRRAAVRAEAQARRGDAVLGPALVAARLRRFSLGDCHQRPAV